MPEVRAPRIVGVVNEPQVVEISGVLLYGVLHILNVALHVKCQQLFLKKQFDTSLAQLGWMFWRTQ